MSIKKKDLLQNKNQQTFSIIFSFFDRLYIKEIVEYVKKVIKGKSDPASSKFLSLQVTLNRRTRFVWRFDLLLAA